MEVSFFDKQIKRLQDQWPRSYGNERKFELWLTLKDKKEEFVKDAISYFLNDNQRPPLLLDFRNFEIVWERRQLAKKAEEIQADPVKQSAASNCKRCDQGLHYPTKSDGTTYVLRCRCPLGDLHPIEFPREQIERTYAKPEEQIQTGKPYKDD